MKSKYQFYPKYKPSGIDWLGQIPEEWEILKVKHLFSISKETSFEVNPTILSLTQHGIKKRDITNNEGQIASSYFGYRKISIGDIVLNIMDLLSGFVDRSQYNGVISPAYTTLKPTKKIETKYFNYFFQKHYFEKIFFPFGQGVSVDHRWTLKDFTLFNFPIVKPTFEDQEKIAKFLDYKLEKIDKIINKNNRLIKLLQEKRQAVITLAVTKGLNPKAKMKCSGIDWLGDIPEEWKTKRLRFLVTLQKGRKPEENTESVDGLPYLTMDFLRGQGEATKYTPSRESVVVDDKEILLLWDGANAGEFVKGSKGILSSTMAKVSFDKYKLNSKYYFYFLKSFEKKLRELTIGMGIPHVNGEVVKNCIALIPSNPEQIAIADFVDRKTTKIDKVMKKVEIQNEKLKEFRQALISSAVTGKIQV